MKNPTPTFNVSCETRMKALSNNIPEEMNKSKRRNKVIRCICIIIGLISLFLLLSCTAENDSNCDEELQKLEKLRSQGWTNCNGGSACVAKIESDYQSRKKEILNNCN